MIGPAATISAIVAGMVSSMASSVARPWIVRGLALLADAEVAADRRQDRGSDGRADQRQRKLVQAVGLAQIDEAALGKSRREISVEKLADVIAAGADRGGQDEDQQFLDARRHLRRQQLQAQPGAMRRDNAEAELQNSADEHGPCHRDGRRFASYRDQQKRAEQGDVEQRRSEGRRDEARQ